MCIEDYEIGGGKFLHRTVDVSDKGRCGKNVPIFFVPFKSQLSYFRDVENKKMLDVGSGWGMTTWKALMSGFDVTAVDVAYKNEKPLNHFKEYVVSRTPKEYKDNLKIRDDNFLTFYDKNPHLKSSYDLINIQSVFHFYPIKGITKMIKDSALLLKDGGRLVIATESEKALCYGNKTCEDKFHKALKGKSLPWSVYYKDNIGKGISDFEALENDDSLEYSFQQESNVVSSTKTFFDTDSLSALVSENGFKVIDVHSWGGTFVSLSAEKVNELPVDTWGWTTVASSVKQVYDFLSDPWGEALVSSDEGKVADLPGEI